MDDTGDDTDEPSPCHVHRRHRSAPRSYTRRQARSDIDDVDDIGAESHTEVSWDSRLTIRECTRFHGRDRYVRPSLRTLNTSGHVQKVGNRARVL